MANSVDPDQTAPIGAVCTGSTLFASILNSSVMLDNYLQQTTSADNIFRCNFFLGALRVSYGPCLFLYSSDRRKSAGTLHTEAKKQFLINQLPHILRLHLKRFR